MVEEIMIKGETDIDIINIDTSTAKFGITRDTPDHIEQNVITIRAKLESPALNGGVATWFELRTTVKCWKMMHEAFALAVRSKTGAFESKFKEKRRYMASLRKNNIPVVDDPEKELPTEHP